MATTDAPVDETKEEVTAPPAEEEPSGTDESKTASETQPKIGCIRLEYKYPPAPGDMDSKLSFGFGIVYEMVKGLTFDVVKDGNPLDETLAERVRGVVDYFNSQASIVGITGDCGFMMHYQQLVQKMSADKLVFLSSLKLAPLIHQSVHPGDKILVLTADSTKLTDKVLRGLFEQVCNMGEEACDKFQVVGCQNVPGFGEEVKYGKRVIFDEALGPLLEMVDTEIKKRSDKDIKVAALLCECTELPQFANSLRSKFRIPVFDIVNLVNFFQSASAMSLRFGQQDLPE